MFSGSAICCYVFAPGGEGRTLPKIYSQDVLNNLFRHPYTKIEFVMNELQVSRPTATARLEALVSAGFLEKLKVGKSNYYMNMPLYSLLRG